MADDENMMIRRRRARFRAWHRGTREMDLIMGRFADATADGWSEAEIRDYEILLELPEADVFAWITGDANVPTQYDTAMFRRLVSFHSAKSGRGGAV